jgi:hypothetical protein
MYDYGNDIPSEIQSDFQTIYFAKQWAKRKAINKKSYFVTIVTYVKIYCITNHKYKLKETIYDPITTSAMIIQRYYRKWKLDKLNKAANVIQRYVKEVLSCPDYLVCKRRLIREFQEL